MDEEFEKKPPGKLTDLALQETVAATQPQTSAPTGAGGPTAVRRSVTVVTVNLCPAGDDALQEELAVPPARREQILSSAERRLCEQGGVVAARSDRLLVVVFPWQGGGAGSEAEAVVGAALNLVSVEREAFSDRRGGEAPALPFALGIGSGPVEMIPPASGSSYFLTAGEPVEWSRRLSGRRSSSGVLICAGTRSAITGGLVIEAWESRRCAEVDVPGVAEVVRRCAGQSLADDLDQFHGVPVELIGREFELGRLLGLLDNSARYGQLNVALLKGGRGTGKTRVSFDFLKSVRESSRRCTALHQSLDSRSGTISFGVLRHLLAQALGTDSAPESPGGAAQRDNFEKLAEGIDMSAVAGLSGELVWAGLWYLLGQGTVKGTPLEQYAAREEGLKQVAFQSVAALFRLLAANTPVVVVIDNVQFADADSLALLAFLVEHFTVSPQCIMVLLTSSLSGRPAVEQIESRSGAEVLELANLREADAARLVEGALKKAGPLPSGLVEKVVRLSDGNPLMMFEVLNYHVDREVIRIAEDRWTVKGGRVRIPPTLESLAEARIRRLPLDEQLVLKFASVAGSVFWLPLVEALTGGKRTRELHRLKKRGFVTELRGSLLPGQADWRFSQGAVQEALYSAISESEQWACHGQVLEWLKEVAEGCSVSPELLASHAEKAGLIDEAIGYYVAAGEGASRIFAQHAAIRNRERALALAQACDRNNAETGRLALKLAEDYMAVGELDKAEACFGRVLQLSGEGMPERREWNSGEGPRRVDALVQARLGMGRLREMRGRPQDALERYRELLEFLGAHDGRQAVEIKILTRMVACHYRLGQPVEAARIEISAVLNGMGKEEREDPELSRCVARFYNAKAVIHMEAGRLQEARELYDTALRFVRAVRDAFGMTVLETNIGNALLYQEDYTAAIAHYMRALRIAEKSGYAYSRAIACNNLGEAHLLTGQVEKAEKMLGTAFQVSSALALTELLPDTLRLQAEVRLVRDEYEAALEKSGEAYKLALKSKDKPSQAMALLTKGKTLSRAPTASGDAARRSEALKVLSQAAKIARESGLSRGLEEIEREIGSLTEVDPG